MSLNVVALFYPVNHTSGCNLEKRGFCGLKPPPNSFNNIPNGSNAVNQNVSAILINRTFLVAATIYMCGRMMPGLCLFKR